MAALVATKRHLWLNLPGIKDNGKSFLLDAPISPQGLFSDAVSAVVDWHQEVKRQSAAFKEFIPRHSEKPGPSSSLTCPPPDRAEKKNGIRAFTASILLCQRETGLVRPVLDLQVLNSALMKSMFKMLTTKLITSQIRFEDWFVMIDLKDAYFHVGIQLEHRKFLRLLEAPFEPMESASEKFLTLKTALLLALASLRQVGDMQALSWAPTCLEFASGMSKAILHPRAGYVPKVTRMAGRLVILQAFCFLPREAYRKRLLSEKDLTFKQACEIALGLELAYKDTKELTERADHSSAGVHKVASFSWGRQMNKPQKGSSHSGKGRELAEMMERRKVDILCVQETRWKGSKARSIRAGFKLFYYGVDSKRNGVGVVLKEEFVRNVLEVKRVSDRVMSLKLEIEGVMLNVVSGYAPQVGCELEEKERFWSELDEVMESIPTGERVVIGADFNGHVAEGNTGDEEVMGKFGVKERNLEGQMVVDFAKRMDMAVVNTYFQKREEHRVTYKSGGRRTQVDYILCRRGNMKEISDCKVVVGESVARQHRMVVCRMTLMVCKTKRSKIEMEKKTKWWKLKKEECCEEFRQKLRQALGGQVVLPDDWETTVSG
ncbi:hypothetical protein QTP86_011634 [Hemibagrus guttatus]|nr:hypothetical protein QTP86_011634 [Hemibagrus guttatus]